MLPQDALLPGTDKVGEFLVHGLDIATAAERTWSVDDEEIAMGVRCVGAPVVDAAGKLCGALNSHDLMRAKVI